MDHPTNTSKAGKKTLANSLVALSSAAVIAVYAAGYARTTPVAGQFVATASVADTATVPSPRPTPTIASTATAQVPTNPARGENPGVQGGGRQRPGSAVSGGIATSISTAVAPTATANVPATAAPALTTAVFRDGTYTGTGTSRHGNIGVTVTIQAGKIVAAEISDCGTRYPCSRIAELPGEAVARQSAAVDVVTGATDSTNAYRAAVNAALAQAR